MIYVIWEVTVLHIYENNQQDALHGLIYYSKSALRVSGGFHPSSGAWLYLQELVVFIQVAAAWCLELVKTELVWDTNWQQLGWTLTDTVNTVICSWSWVKTSSKTCRADLE